ncbi:hypothetical protein FA15DRAFT_683331 [Coprinopsis marcescibilis]|uniref:Uncharacterized protein n=1 Tax=Coprinopsis marcescibilis TaxID=230819 RepID=A0A5C3KE82_COPMA|nr:hypothetical protein FA15DRAFT_683331 [Coprinopsis marcescibilis]
MEFGTGLPASINHPFMFTVFKGPILLELVSMTDIASSLWGVVRRRRKPCILRGVTHPLVHTGRHFGRIIYAFANVHALIMVGSTIYRLLCELHVYNDLMTIVPGLEEQLLSSSEEETMFAANMIQKGANSACSDDTKSLKGVVIDWIAPSDGEPLGFNHERTGFLLCPAGFDWADAEIKQQLKNKELLVTGAHWPNFLYRNEKFDPDEPWRGLLRGELIVKAYKHIFTSPSSVGIEPKATRSGNARIHGMSSVTRASVAYVATQVRFALCDTNVFSRTDKETDSETFYVLLLELLEDPEEQGEVKELLLWWNRQIFPSFSTVKRIAPSNTALAKIKEKRAILKRQAALGQRDLNCQGPSDDADS